MNDLEKRVDRLEKIVNMHFNIPSLCDCSSDQFDECELCKKIKCDCSTKSCDICSERFCNNCVNEYSKIQNYNFDKSTCDSCADYLFNINCTYVDCYEKNDLRKSNKCKSCARELIFDIDKLLNATKHNGIWYQISRN